MSNVVASIIICTRDRADSLRETLASLAGCVAPPDLPTELLVVDNGSRDHTRQVVEAAPVHQVALRYVFEPMAGQCHARNRGLHEARGEIILFTDDDVRLPTDWLVQMCTPILRDEADAIAGGIKIAPHLERSWFSQGHFRGWLASTDQMDPHAGTRLVGANMAFSRRVLSKVENFDVALGPGALGFEDEALFSRRLLHAGYRLKPRLDVAVEHHFDPARLNRASMLQMARRAGRSQGYVAHHWEHKTLRWRFLRLIKAAWRLFWWRLSHPSRWLFQSDITWDEWSRVRWFAFQQEYLKAVRQPRKYRAETSHGPQGSPAHPA